MQRRALVRALMIGMPAAAAGAAGAAVKSASYLRDTSEQSLQAMKQRLDELKQRMDRSEAVNKKWIKLLLVLTALSLGIDASALL